MTAWETVFQFDPIIEKYVARYGGVTVPEIRAYVGTESSGDPNKMNPHDPSFGLGSIEIAVALEWQDPELNKPPLTFYSKADMDKLFDPDFNIQVLTRYAAHLKAQFGNHPNWMAAYNQGPGNEAKGLQDQGYVDLWTTRYNEIEQAAAGRIDAT